MKGGEGHAVGDSGSVGWRYYSNTYPAGAAFAVTAARNHGKPCFGTIKGDHLQGTKGDDEILARGGLNFVDARAGSDVVHGGSGDDGDGYAHSVVSSGNPRRCRPTAFATATICSTATAAAMCSMASAARTCSSAAAGQTTSSPGSFAGGWAVPASR